MLENEYFVFTGTLTTMTRKQAKGIALAKKKGRFKGGKRKYQENEPRLQLAFKLFLDGYTDKEVEEQTGVNRRTFKRYRKRQGIEAKDRIKGKKKEGVQYFV